MSLRQSAGETGSLIVAGCVSCAETPSEPLQRRLATATISDVFMRLIKRRLRVPRIVSYLLTLKLTVTVLVTDTGTPSTSMGV